jgi:hypothetical protein
MIDSPFLVAGAFIAICFLIFWMCKPWKVENVTPPQQYRAPPQNPNDFTQSSTASNWISDHYCPECKASFSHEEVMTGICLSCGAYCQFAVLQRMRAVRKIWNGDQWVTQFRYPDGEVVVLDHVAKMNGRR